VRVDVRERRSVPWQLIAAAALLVLLGTLGTLQYRWLGEVSEAERQRMRAGLQTRAADFTQAFDRELTQIYVAFHGTPDVFEHDPSQAIAAALSKVQTSAVVPGLIKDVFLLEARGAGANLLQRYDRGAGALQPAEWPPALEAWRRQDGHGAALELAGVFPMFIADAVAAKVPALIVPMPLVKKIAGVAGQVTVVPEPGGAARALIVVLDADRLRQQLLEPLVARYFGTGDASEYLVTIVQRDDPATIVYTSARNAIVDERADVSTGMFDLRMNEITRVGGLGPPLGGDGPKTLTDRIAVTIVRRATPGDAARLLTSGGDGQGAWLVRARYRTGSLESIVASSRRRNLAISVGVLGLLGAAFILILAAAQRQRRLAKQQMEFVASVSHELRTPLAVICSAGENLADGVVADAAQVRTYGSLIEAEGRRLGDMVERVMEFAGISSGAPIRARGGVDVAAIAADVVQGISAEARVSDVALSLHTEGTLPAITADADALRSALQNIVGNAVKYSTKGGSVDVTVRAVGDLSRRSPSHARADGVEFRVADHGLGIDPEDLPHIFQPFFRGRRAVDAQVRGTGVGLSVVRHAIAAHQGTVTVDSRVGEGTVVTVTLPMDASATASPHVGAASRPARAERRRHRTSESR
jgi:signal transduction histidine kinase